MSPALKKTLGVLAVAALLAAAGFFTLGGLLATGSGASARVASLLHRSAAIDVADQGPSEEIRVGMAALTSPGFIIIYDDEEGPGRILGVSRRLSKGVARGVSVPLRQLPADGYYYAMLRADDGDGVFDPDKDAPERDARGAVVMTRFLASTGE